MTFRGGQIPPEPFDWEKFFKDLQRSAQRRTDLIQSNHQYAWILHQQPKTIKPRAWDRWDFEDSEPKRRTCCDTRPAGGYCTHCGRGPNDELISPNRALASNA